VSLAELVNTMRMGAPFLHPEILVLLSGGVDSSACVNFYRELGRPVCGLFVDYGQPAAAQEARSALAVAKYYSVPLRRLVLHGSSSKSVGLIQGRNMFLLALAVMERPKTVTVIAIGIHSGTQYVDCSRDFLVSAQRFLDLLEPGVVRFSAPFLEWNKGEILSYCLDARVPLDLTYSCERGGPEPCMVCSSCRDRESLNACSPIQL
jgi:7-cyano-7-deazaguanine synthase